jgi:hypothetical protein
MKKFLRALPSFTARCAPDAKIAEQRFEPL